MRVQLAFRIAPAKSWWYLIGLNQILGWPQPWHLKLSTQARCFDSWAIRYDPGLSPVRCLLANGKLFLFHFLLPFYAPYLCAAAADCLLFHFTMWRFFFIVSCFVPRLVFVVPNISIISIQFARFGLRFQQVAAVALSTASYLDNF